MEYIRDNWQNIVAITGILGFLGIGFTKTVEIKIFEIVKKVLKYIFNLILKPFKYILGINSLEQRMTQGEKIDEDYIVDSAKLDSLIIVTDTILSKLDNLEKNQDFTEARQVKKSIIELKKDHSREYLNEDEFHRFFEQKDSYLFLQKKYPDEMNGNMTGSINFLTNEYELGHICTGECTTCLGNCKKKTTRNN